MHNVKWLLVPLFMLAFLAGCSEPAQEEPGEQAAGGETFSNAGLPVIAPSADIFKLYMQAQDRADMGDFIEANQLARQVTEKAPGFVAGWLMLSNTALSAEQFVKASHEAQKNRDKGTMAEQIWTDINMSLVDNNTEQSVQFAEDLVAAFPDSPRAWLVLAGTQAGQNQHEDARASALRAIELDPDFAPGHNTLGLSYLFNDPKDLTEAETHIMHVTELRPSEENAWINLGDVHRAMGDLEQARLEYGKAMEMDPTNSIAPVKRGHVNSFLGNYDEAREDYDKGIALGKELSRATLANYRAFVHLHEGQTRAAVEELKDLLERIDSMDMPDHQKLSARNFTLANLADICLFNEMDKEAVEAVQALSASLKKSGANSGDEDFANVQAATAAYWEGRLAAHTGEFETAEAKANEYLALLEDDQNPRKMENYYEIMGLIALEQAEFEQAAENFRYSNLNPGGFGGDIKNKYMLAVALESAGEEQEARSLYDEVANYNFNSVWFAMVGADVSEGG